MNAQMAELFDSNWSTYRQVLGMNYMFHHDLAQIATEALQELVSSGYPIHVLDLGCGDAWYFTEYQNVMKNIQYTGYDLSEYALSKAKLSLEKMVESYQLKQGHMEELIKEDKNEYSLIYSSFAIHHLQDDVKFNLIQDCYHRLPSGGLFIIIDVFRADHEDRSAYLDSYFENIRNRWDQVDVNEKALIFDHILNYDFPTSLYTFKNWCSQCGFEVKKTFKADPHHVIIVNVKP
ncbi:MAG TPA: class I SAM-dependent methyltransferase [Saprospiraceae bacterium]|nr:class I SAM-dependent methyltransferase [Saprospiraceae bacterium]